tara:strand:+ start:57 stop:377 length:321 start_codon:yes stop_codon:yes gene_type:complete
MDAKLFFPQKSVKNEDYYPMVTHSKNILDRGIDPKPKLIDFCSQGCIYWKEKLQRCEKKLPDALTINPSKSCLYPMRDWVICVDACVNPKIFDNLQKGKNLKNDFY